MKTASAVTRSVAGSASVVIDPAANTLRWSVPVTRPMMRSGVSRGIGRW
jgi:hypothetical protein